MPVNFYLLVGFGYTIIFPVIIGLIRYKKMLKSYRVFVIFTCLALLNESISFALIEVRHSNAVNGNIYVLVEAIVLLVLFYQWESFKKKVLYLLIGMVVLIWLGENVVFSSILHINSLFRLFYALMIVVLSIDQINITLLYEHRKMEGNAKFLICCLFAFYFAFKATYEVFYFVPLHVMSKRFYNSLFLVFVFVNVFTNLGYALAALWIPKKQRFTLPY